MVRITVNNLTVCGDASDGGEEAVVMLVRVNILWVVMKLTFVMMKVVTNS